MAVPLKYKKASEKILENFGLKPNKSWIDQDSDFYNRSTKS